MSFTVSVAAADRSLLTLDECKAALGITATTSDTALNTLRAQISDMIAEECCVPASGVITPTFRSETIIETFRLGPSVPVLTLARRWATSITSVVEDGVTLANTLYEVEPSTGLLTRLDADDGQIAWDASKVVVTYIAGFSTVPENLKLAAITVLREQWASARRDPLMKRERVDGIGEREFWVNSSTSGGVAPAAISSVASAMLGPYRYFPV
jgi:hypothetical protein